MKGAIGAEEQKRESKKIPAHLKQYEKYRVHVVTDEDGDAVPDAAGAWQYEKETLQPDEVVAMEPRFAEELNRQSHNSGVRYYECEAGR